MHSSKVRSELVHPLPCSRGFTLIEMLVTLVIVAILAAIFFQGSQYVIQHAETVRCGNNLRQLHVAFSAYLQDHSHWPQEPESLSNDPGSVTSQDWWVTELTPYGAPEKVWQCPTMQRLVTAKSSDGRPKISYSPTQFDDKPSTPTRWANQPWLIELGNMHGKGALMCFPDGSVRAMDEVMATN